MFYYTFTTFDCNFIPRNAEICKVSSETKNVGKAHKYRLNRHLPTYEKIIKNLYSFYHNNQIEELEIDKQMIASKDVEEMVPFAVLAEKSEISKAVDHIKDTVKTGDNSSVILLFGIVVVAGIVAGGVIYWRKKKVKK